MLSISEVGNFVSYFTEGCSKVALCRRIIQFCSSSKVCHAHGDILLSGVLSIQSVVCHQDLTSKAGSLVHGTICFSNCLLQGH